MKIIEKLVALFCVIIFVTFLVNHGQISFAGVDWVVNKATDAITSEQGKQYISETKDIAKNVLHDIFYGIKAMFTDDDRNEETDESSDSSTDTG